MSLRPIQAPSSTPSYQPATRVPTTDEIDQSISYGELTKIPIDHKTKTNVRESCHISLTTKFISVQQARIINSKAKREIIKLNSKSVESFPIDKYIRERIFRLQQTHNISSLSQELGFGITHLSTLGTGRIQTIKKARADQYNQYLKDRHLSEIFDLGRIFRLALEQPLQEKTQKLCEQIWIQFNKEHRHRMHEMPEEKKRNPFLEKKLMGTTESIRLKDAVMINKMSEKDVFDFTRDSVVAVPVLRENIDELLLSIASKSVPENIQKAVNSIVAEYSKTITPEMGSAINSSLRKTVFDIESLLAKAISEAEQLTEEIAPSKKRSLSDIGPPARDLKKPRIEISPQRIASTQAPTITENVGQTYTRGPLSEYQFQYPVAPPQAAQNPNPRFDLKFILN